MLATKVPTFYQVVSLHELGLGAFLVGSTTTHAIFFRKKIDESCPRQ